ncbi:hypothetical protein ASPZODRAFT_892689 [Penicilliopsis zonata CBS 506.65]|uniref:BTB domain-containing protein n=1 Tax=Penicilliopsis zonata CBS 506.65 TaxID=1073090 RepID=A0A1L9S9Q9_9EURO|nr:hypothetical protein ASPZODRAFT_892689 [Penicilliopsis zonata CBS 506.65]OJJ43900.1 hypothetical protein ASPZODRAFT_892689 [Penicilliopsis zonata CBS 506.65]
MLRNTGFPENKTNIVRFPEDSVKAFAIFAEWLYHGEMYSPQDTYRSLWKHGVGEQDENYIGGVEKAAVGIARKRPVSSVASSKTQVKKKAKIEEAEEVDETEDAETEDDETEDDLTEDDETEDDETEDDLTEDDETEEDTDSEEDAEGETESEEEMSDDEEGDSDDCEEVEERNAALARKITNDYYDFSIEFACYVFADKIQAPGFLDKVLSEINYHADFCDPATLTTKHIRYAYQNTFRANDPLRKVCMMVKFERVPIEQTLADPAFKRLLEQGGPIVADVMEICRKHAQTQSEKTTGK